jgi:hypothetical protein
MVIDYVSHFIGISPVILFFFFISFLVLGTHPRKHITLCLLNLFWFVAVSQAFSFLDDLDSFERQQFGFFAECLSI